MTFSVLSVFLLGRSQDPWRARRRTFDGSINATEQSSLEGRKAEAVHDKLALVAELYVVAIR